MNPPSIPILPINTNTTIPSVNNTPAALNIIAITQITNGYPTTMIVIDGIIKYWNSGGPVDSKLINELSKQYIEILNQGK